MSSKPQDRTNQQSKPWRRAGWRPSANKPGAAAKGVFNTATYHAPAQVIIDQGDGKTLHIHVAGTMPLTQPWLASAEERPGAPDEDRAIEETDRALAQVAANVEVMRRDQQEIDQLRAETRVLLHQLGVA